MSKGAGRVVGTPAHKRAKVHHPIHEILQVRWSPLAFTAEAVAKEELCSLFEAARWAPSSFNEQPWTYLVARKEEAAEFEKMLSVLVEGNQAWAKAAPVLAISVAKKTFTKGGKPNRHAFHDVGQATAFLAIEATSRGLVVHQMAGYDAEKARAVYAIPEEFEPVAAMAIGYPGTLEDLPESLRGREGSERTRKAVSEFVYEKKWGNPAGAGCR